MTTGRTRKQLRARRRARTARVRCIEGLSALAIATVITTGALCPAPSASGDHQGPPDIAQTYTAASTGAPHGPATAAYAATTPEEVARVRRGRVIAAILAGDDVSEPFAPVLVAGAGPGTASTETTLVWPVEGAERTDGFGDRGGAHEGVDLAAALGTPLRSVAPGVVTLSSEAHGAYGVTIVIRHAGGAETLYGHLQHGSRLVDVGDWVEAGQVIGSMGSTGRSTGSHLHFEIRIDGTPVDPLPFLDAEPPATTENTVGSPAQ